jgi:hypothetical protein
MSYFLEIYLLLVSFSLGFFLILVCLTFLATLWLEKYNQQKELNVLVLISLTIILFSLPKYFGKEVLTWEIPTIIVVLLLLNPFIKTEWERKFLNLRVFKLYFRVMMYIEDLFLSSMVLQLVISLIFWSSLIMYYCTDLKLDTISHLLYYTILLGVILYIRLRLKVFTITELIDYSDLDILHRLDSNAIDAHFLKMRGVAFNLRSANSKSVLTLFGLNTKNIKNMPKGAIFNVRKYLGRITVTSVLSLWAGFRNVDLSIGNALTIAHFNHYEARLENLVERVVYITNQKKEIMDLHLLQQVLENRHGILIREYRSIHRWMDDQNGVVNRFFCGSLMRNPQFYEKQRHFRRAMFDFEYYLDRLEKEDQLGANSRALVPYISPTSDTLSFSDFIVGIWV